MASLINASTSGGGGVIVTSDASGDLNIQSGGSTVVAVTSAGVAVTGTLSSSGASTFTGTGKFATTIGVGNATPAASGSGITFPATQSASSNANTLDDYEEGTWTPTLTASLTNPTATYSAQLGRYTKIGRFVSIQCYIETISRTGGSGQAQITGLPFNVTANTAGYGGVTASQSANLTGSSTAGIRPNPNTSYLNIQINSGGSALDIGSWNAVGYFIVSLSYTTD